jgi:hypothetical protein
LEIYSANGQKIALLLSGLQNQGQHRVVWDAGNHPSGIYFYQLTTEFLTARRKMLLVR